MNVRRKKYFLKLKADFSSKTKSNTSETEEKQAFRKLKLAITNHKTMPYFDPNKPIILWTETSFLEGLSAALFQKCQTVHFVSRSLTDAERQYSQTEN